jgi:hypothetical protein
VACQMIVAQEPARCPGRLRFAPAPYEAILARGRNDQAGHALDLYRCDAADRIVWVASQTAAGTLPGAPGGRSVTGQEVSSAALV